MALSLALTGCGGLSSLGVGAGAEVVPVVPVIRQVFVRQVGAEGNLQPVDATQLSAPVDARGGMKVAWVLEDGAPVAAGDVVVRFDDTKAIKDRLNGEADLEVASRKLEQERLTSQEAIRGRERTAGLASKEMADSQEFRSRDAEIYSRNQITQSTIDAELAAARVEHADTSRAIEERLASSKIALIELSQKRAQLAIDRAQGTLDRLELTAPHEGVVVLKRSRRGDVTRIGDTVWPGQRIAEIPELDKLEAQIFVLEADAAGLAEGLDVSVFLDAHPGTAWPGTVKTVDKLAKPRQRDAPVQYFEVIVTLQSVDPTVMKPGQRVHATLTLGGEEALVVPRQAIFERDGETVAWRRQGTEWEPARLELGVSSPGLVTVVSGLDEGDEVAVRDPNRSAASEADADAGGAP